MANPYQAVTIDAYSPPAECDEPSFAESLLEWMTSPPDLEKANLEAAKAVQAAAVQEAAEQAEAQTGAREKVPPSGPLQGLKSASQFLSSMLPSFGGASKDAPATEGKRDALTDQDGEAGAGAQAPPVPPSPPSITPDQVIALLLQMLDSSQSAGRSLSSQLSATALGTGGDVSEAMLRDLMEGKSADLAAELKEAAISNLGEIALNSVMSSLGELAGVNANAAADHPQPPHLFALGLLSGQPVALLGLLDPSDEETLMAKFFPGSWSTQDHRTLPNRP